MSRGIVVQEQEPLGDLPAAFLLQNVLQFQMNLAVVRIIILMAVSVQQHFADGTLDRRITEVLYCGFLGFVSGHYTEDFRYTN